MTPEEANAQRLEIAEHMAQQSSADLRKLGLDKTMLQTWERKVAQDWFDMWERMLPDDDRLEMIRPLLNQSMLARFGAKQMLAALRE